MNVIQLPHKVLDYACPINGLEDQYEWKTGARWPGYFLMDVSNIGFSYLKYPDAPAPRMVGWGNGVGKAQYEFLANLIGYRLDYSECRPFEEAWQVALAHVAQGAPVILGPLDMYHLPHYPKFYHRVHIPQHFVLLVGYDETRKAALVQDNGLPGVQVLPLSDLRLAWDVDNPGQGSKNSLYTLVFGSHIAGVDEVIHRGLQKRAHAFLNAPVAFMGLRGMYMAADDLLLWATELSEAQWVESLRFLATFTCSVVPNLPQPLLPFTLGYDDPHQACRDRLAQALAHYAQQYGQPQWQRAAQLLQTSGAMIGQLTQATVAVLMGEVGAMSGAPDLLRRIADVEEQAFRLLL